MPSSAVTTLRRQRAERAVALAEALLRDARGGQTPEELDHARRLSRLMEDPRGKELTIALTDQAFRSRRPTRIADQLAYLIDRYGPPRFMEWWERAALVLGGVMGQYLPSLVVPPIVARLRHETESLILPAEEEELRRYLEARRAQGIRLNLNQLGEAILGEAEAARRLRAYLDLLARPDVEYISVKVSSVFSQINLVAFGHTVEQVKGRLRTLYRQALAHQYCRADGRVAPKFINLDMEEFRDLDPTVTAFREVLDEEEFARLPAGIVLQAYLPESHRVQRALTDWALARTPRGGAPIKLRIVKGANLAMERIDAHVHDWPQAPYATKREVDANWKRMVEYGCRPDRARAVHLGIASHNLFDVAYALVLRQDERVEPWVEFEMLEGMANQQARAVQAQAGGLRLYAPVVRSEDFHSAIAYLVRRLDENTAEDNFLRHVFGLEPGTPEWDRERDRFLSAFEIVDELSDAPRRTQDRSREVAPVTGSAADAFANESDTDWALGQNRDWIADVMAAWHDRPVETVPLQIGGELLHGAAQVDGRDRSRPERVAYRHALADWTQMSRALDVARRALTEWSARPLHERRALLEGAALVLGCRRGDLIGAMIVDGAKTVTEADPEVSEAIDFARYYARSLDHVDAIVGCWMEPLGVVLIAPPWNFPLSIPAGGVLAALVAGNTVLLKPAPEAVLVSWHLASALWDAGIPRDALQFVPCPDDDVGRALVTDPRVDAVVLTGSIETARRFLSWRPELALFAETSGKNAMIITALSDRDQAIRDLVRSAFGHNGQKCSAASLAICEAEVYDDPVFRRQLRDAAASLDVGSAWDTASRVTPLTQPPGEALTRALTRLDDDEEWLLEPRPLPGPAPLWSPGIKLGVRRGSFFHRTECFGPVLGLMRAETLDEAIDLANDTPFGLTAGIESLDDREIARFIDRMEAGNLYVNRHITGAIVGRQPFGGWKASSAGPGAKAGGPNYVLQLARWRQVALPDAWHGDGRHGSAGFGSGPREAPLSPALSALLARCCRVLESDVVEARAAISSHKTEARDPSTAEPPSAPEPADVLHASAVDYALAWANHFGCGHDPSQVLGEQNLFRYLPCRHVLIRGEAASAAGRLALAQSLLAAATSGVPVTVSLSGDDLWPWLAEQPGVVTAVVEDETALMERLQSADAERLRLLEDASRNVRVAAHRRGIAVIDAPVVAAGRLELRWYQREQTVSRTLHRYGNVMKPATTE